MQRPSNLAMALFGMAWLLKVRDEIKKELPLPPSQRSTESCAHSLPRAKPNSSIRRLRQKQTEKSERPCCQLGVDEESLSSSSALCDLVLVQEHNGSQPARKFRSTHQLDSLLEDGVPPPPPPPAAVLRRPPLCSCYKYAEMEYGPFPTGELPICCEGLCYDLRQNHFPFRCEDFGKGLFIGLVRSH